MRWKCGPRLGELQVLGKIEAAFPGDQVVDTLNKLGLGRNVMPLY
jgi:hypothetical protein